MNISYKQISEQEMPSGIGNAKADQKVNRSKNMRILLSFLFLIFWYSGSAQQESMYSQYMFNMLHINPAYAGYRADNSFALTFRNQWVGLRGAPRTGTATWDNLANEGNIGYGVGIYYDQLGIERTSGFQSFFAYHIPFDNSYLSLGLSGGVLNYKAMYSESELLDPDDPLFQDDVNGWLPTAGFGVLYVSENWYASFSVPALLHTKIGVQNRLNQTGFGGNNHYFLSVGYNFYLSDYIKVKPSFMLKAVKGSPLQYDINMNWWYGDQFGIGLSYRLNDALVGLLQLQITNNLRIGYSYDYSLSDISSYSKGSHEIFLRYELAHKKTPKWRDDIQ